MLSMDEKIERTVAWIRETVEGAGCKGVVLGLSGGIDSTLVAFLIKRAFPESAIGVILPCKSHGKDREDAMAAAAAAGLEAIEVEISEPHDLLLDKVMGQLGDKALPENRRLTDANLRARLRMSTLYTVANALGYLVAGTDNAAEVYTGYFTKYGDGGVDFLPIASLTKREVYAWCRHLGAPQSVIDRPPSAGLWEGQTDESEMGTTYDRIDDLLEGKPIPEADRKIIERLHQRSHHKRVMPPAAPKFR